MVELREGTAATRDFYNLKGWRRRDGMLTDTHLFGWRAGPICDSLDVQRKERVLRAVGQPNPRIAELGCGGTPATFLAQTAAEYTAVDFSSVGLAEAAVALRNTGTPFRVVEADITSLPFQTGAFDVVYSAQAIYHIDTIKGQSEAFREAMRIVRPGGRAIFIMGNPFPLLFPLRLMRRVLAMTPFIGTVLNRLRAKPPLPYLPMPLGWMRAELEQWGAVEITGHAVPSVDFDRLVPETSVLGRAIWRGVRRLETHHAKLGARLGCYVLIVVHKPENRAVS